MEENAPVMWFGWFRPDILVEYRQLFWEGMLVTVGMTVACILMGCTLGLLIALARLAHARHQPWKSFCKYLLRWPSTVYVSFFRGTPLFVQILLMHFAVMPLLVHPADGLLISGELARELKQSHGALLSGVAALTLNSAAYISEVFRAGIQSITRGQRFAGMSLGMTPAQVMRYVVLPQAFRRMLPPLGNNMIALLKDTAQAGDAFGAQRIRVIRVIRVIQCACAERGGYCLNDARNESPGCGLFMKHEYRK